MYRWMGIKKPRGPGETTGTIIQKDNHENIYIIARRRPFDKGDTVMIPEHLREQWEAEQRRAELLFLADHGGGYPDALSPPNMDVESRRLALRVMRFRVREEYKMPIEILKPPTPDNLEPWVRLTNDVAVNLANGFVSRTKRRMRSG